jgi:hypothetical protein
MNINQLIEKAEKDTKSEHGTLKNDVFVGWLLKKALLNEVSIAISEDPIDHTPLSKPYNNKRSIEKVLNSAIFLTIAEMLINQGKFKEGEDVFKKLLEIAPEDTTTLNNYGVMIINEQLVLYSKKEKLCKERIEESWKLISKAAIIDRILFDKPMQFPAYKNLCLLRAVEAAYYLEEKHCLPAFLLSWMSIEMSLHRIWQITLEEIGYFKSKIESFERWNIDTVIETLFMSKCDPEFLKLKTPLDILRGHRNDLLHGRIFDITIGTARFSIQTAFNLIPIKQK